MSGGPSSGWWMLALEDEVMTNKKYLDALLRRLAGLADSSATDGPKSNSFRAVGVESVRSTMIQEASACLGVPVGLFKTVMSASLSAPVAVTVTQDDNAPPLTPLHTPSTSSITLEEPEPESDDSPKTIREQATGDTVKRVEQVRKAEEDGKERERRDRSTEGKKREEVARREIERKERDKERKEEE
ncbi:hypothetical protein SNE40_004766 [Patella caerulea]|uniref:Uncharacterized protein n=1 Tax=Patella caerulea TaxID=87958 RepID=A0AAN8KCN0_PATCE